MNPETPVKFRRGRPTVIFVLAELKESFLMAFSSIAAHKLRSSLTLLGILIGVFSIVAVMTIIRLMERNVESNLSQLGPNTFSITKFPGLIFDSRCVAYSGRRLVGGCISGCNFGG